MFLEVKTMKWVDEPGVGIIEIPHDLYSKLMGKEFKVIHGVPILTANQKRKDLLNLLAAKRWQIQTAGIQLSNGLEVETSDASLNRITQVVANASLGGLKDGDEVSFKGANGFVILTIGQIKQIAGLIVKHIQACFAAEHAHSDAISDLKDDELDDYDLNVNWPDGSN